MTTSKSTIATPGVSTVQVENLNATNISLGANASPEEIGGDQVFLFAILHDESGSMSGYDRDVVAGFNEMLKDLLESKSADEILMSSWLFNTDSRVLHGYLPLASIEKLDGKYFPGGGTAMFDAFGKALEDPNVGVVEYAKSLEASGLRVRVCIVIFSDGADNSSRSYTASSIKKLVDELNKTEQYTFSFVAFGGDDAKNAARAMGIDDKNILEVSASPSEYRHAMGTISKSVIRASQTTINPASGNGFFTP